MKKIFLSLLAGSMLMLTGCLETTQEITLNEDGSGTYVNTSDMSKIVPAIKNMGMANSDELPGGGSFDTTLSFSNQADSMEDISNEDKELLKKGSMKMKMSLEDEKLFSVMTFPISSLADIKKVNALAGKMMTKAMTDKMPKGMGAMGGGKMPAPSSFDDYYSLEFSKDKLERKLDKDKYANVANDQMLNGLKQAGEMGVPVTTTYIINLPRPAEKVEGKNAKLSEDKKKVTVSATIDDFFDNPENLEFKIKY